MILESRKYIVGYAKTDHLYLHVGELKATLDVWVVQRKSLPGDETPQNVYRTGGEVVGIDGEDAVVERGFVG
jgi:hypothetical protein